MRHEWRKYKFINVSLCRSLIMNNTPTDQHIEKLKQWILSHPLIKISALNKMAGLPSNTIKDSFILGRRKFPSKHLAAVITVLKAYGYTE